MINESEIQARVTAALDRHPIAVLQVSGGKDSLACIELLRPLLDRLIVLWVNTGDAPTETMERMAQLQREAPRFVEVLGHKEAIVAEHGIPTDLLPAQCTPLGRLTNANAPAMQARYDCCARSMWLPAADAIAELGATLVLRGQKAADALKPDSNDGDRGEGFELLHPLEHATDAEVFEFLEQRGVALPMSYRFSRTSIDCTTCTAYMEEANRIQYVRQYEAHKFNVLQARMQQIAAWVLPAADAFQLQLAETVE